jgi:hypothetical protein
MRTILSRFKISITENGDSLENAIAERVNGIIKEEYLQNYANQSHNLSFMAEMTKSQEPEGELFEKCFQ